MGLVYTFGDNSRCQDLDDYEETGLMAERMALARLSGRSVAIALARRTQRVQVKK